MSETMSSNKPSEIASRLNNFNANQADFEAQQFEDSLMGEAGKTDFSDEARTRLEEASAYEDHLKSMAGRDEAHDPFEAGLDALDNGETADILDRAIQDSPQLRRANMIAQDIARRRAEGGAENDAYVIDQEAKLESLLNAYTESADSDEDVALRIIETTAGNAPATATAETEAPVEAEAESPASDDAEAERKVSSLDQVQIDAALAARAEALQAQAELNEDNVRAAAAAREAALAQPEESQEELQSAARPDRPVPLTPARPVAEQIEEARADDGENDTEVEEANLEADDEQEDAVVAKKRGFGRRVLGRVFRSKRHTEKREAVLGRYRELRGNDEAALPTRFDRIAGVGVGVSDFQQAKKEVKQERKAEKKKAKTEKKEAKKAEEKQRYEQNWRRNDQEVTTTPKIVDAPVNDDESQLPRVS